MTEPGGDQRRPWWDHVDTAVEDAARDLPDPWHDDDPLPALTHDQEAFLAGLEDQPAVPRLTGLEDDGDDRDERHDAGRHPGDEPA
jgi:hypothetical protein